MLINNRELRLRSTDCKSSLSIHLFFDMTFFITIAGIFSPVKDSTSKDVSCNVTYNKINNSGYVATSLTLTKESPRDQENQLWTNQNRGKVAWDRPHSRFRLWTWLVLTSDRLANIVQGIEDKEKISRPLWVYIIPNICQNPSLRSS